MMISNPLALIAEITHRCPLHCVYCSNPLELAAASSELSTAEWVDIFQQAGKLGMLHAHFTGGEPLARPDLTELIAARAPQAFTPISSPPASAWLKHDCKHWSMPDSITSNSVFRIRAKTQPTGLPAPKRTRTRSNCRALIRQHKIAFTVNLVVHRQNIDHLEEMIAFIEQLAPERMEIAHTQYYGWALQNRAALLPTRAQLEKAVEAVAAAEKRLAGRIRIDSVVPDYYARFPKACMGGWGRRLMLINPAGKVLPCHAAEVIPGLEFENVREQTLEFIWKESSSFQRFRGEEWMPEPCRSCDQRTEDFGGCRCQALLLAGNAAATDPACSLAPAHHIVEAALAEANSSAAVSQPVAAASFVQLQQRAANLWSYRTNPE